MFDIINEIIASLKQNKLRTALTGLSVSWGIFILIVLMGSGNGLKHGIMENFGDRAKNNFTIWGGWTSKPFKGYASNRPITFRQHDVDFIESEVPEMSNLSPNVGKSIVATYGKESGSYQVKGVTGAYQRIEKPVIKAGDGRFINDYDQSQRNKVVVIDKKIAESLFPKTSALGKYINLGGVMFRVVGINSKKEEWGGPRLYIPYTTYTSVFDTKSEFNRVSFFANSIVTDEQNEQFTKNLSQLISQYKEFDPTDEQALVITSAQKNYQRMMTMFGGITTFVTIIGILTLIAGIVGVSNIMLVSVKERTREIGIRKAIGAPPSHILWSIILEAILITAVFGYIGMVLGIGVTELINTIMEQQAAAAAPTDKAFSVTVFKDPTVDLGYAIFSTLLLVVAGVIAGYMPARKAVKVKPIEAMRQE